jgi:plasmid segregation protein ParM
MELTVRAIDVGFGNTKYVSAVNITAAGTEIRCGSFPSMADS